MVVIVDTQIAAMLPRRAGGDALRARPAGRIEGRPASRALFATAHALGPGSGTPTGPAPGERRDLRGSAAALAGR